MGFQERADSMTKDMKDIVALCKRRGFIFPASDIYGGINGFWDFGPLGVELKNNLRDLWWKAMVITPPIGPDGVPVEIVGLSGAVSGGAGAPQVRVPVLSKAAREISARTCRGDRGSETC